MHRSSYEAASIDKEKYALSQQMQQKQSIDNDWKLKVSSAVDTNAQGAKIRVVWIQALP